LLKKINIFVVFILSAVTICAQQGILYHPPPESSRYFLAPDALGVPAGRWVYRNIFVVANQLDHFYPFLFPSAVGACGGGVLYGTWA
jgi:hypothetical protein